MNRNLCATLTVLSLLATGYLVGRSDAHQTHPMGMRLKDVSVFSYVGPSTAEDSVWLRPMISPAVEFRLLKGAKPTFGPLMCEYRPSARVKQFVEGDKTQDYAYLVGELHCENGVVLEMVNLDFRH